MMSQPIAVVASRLFDGTPGAPEKNAGVVIRNGKISAVASRSELYDLASSQQLQMIDLSDHSSTLTPGLVDAHCHTAWGFEGVPDWKRALTADSRPSFVADSAEKILRSGVTTIRDVGSPDFAPLEIRDEIQAGRLAGPRIIASGPCITTTNGHGDFIGVEADTRHELMETTQWLIANGVDCIKIMATGGSMDPHTNRRRPQYTAEQITSVVRIAHSQGLPVVAHCNATEGIKNAVEAGVDTIAHCNWLGSEDGTIDYRPELASAIVRQGISIDLNIDATLRPLADGDGFAQEWDPDWTPRHRWDLQQEIISMGGIVFFSSDEFGSNIGQFPRLLARATKELGIAPQEAIARATSIPAQELGLGDVTGLVREGLAADVVLFSGLLDEDPQTLVRPQKIWIGGREISTEEVINR